MFKRCGFIMGEDDSIIIVVPTTLPKDEPMSLEVHERSIVFKLGGESYTEVYCNQDAVIKRLLTKARVGMIEYIQGKTSFPAYISVVADVERGKIAA
jgi:hypothetical protein